MLHIEKRRKKKQIDGTKKKHFKFVRRGWCKALLWLHGLVVSLWILLLKMLLILFGKPLVFLLKNGFHHSHPHQIPTLTIYK